MRRLAAVFVLLLLTTAASTSAACQSTTVRDPQALSWVKQAVSTMAATPPADSVESGNVGLVAGSTSGTGTIQISTRGLTQTSVQVQSPNENWTIIFSHGQASKTDGGISTALSLELASSTQCTFFPLPYLNAVLQNPDSALQYVGSETLGNTTAQHVHIWNTFQSNPGFQFLAPFTATDLWFDSVSGLPLRIAFFQRDGSGATPKIPVTIDYSGFQNNNGLLYPTQIQQSVDGTASMAISITSANFNVGLTDADFPIFEGGN